MKKKLISLVLISLITTYSYSQYYSGEFLNGAFDTLALQSLTDSSHSEKSSLFYKGYYDLGFKNNILPFDVKSRIGNSYLISQNDEHLLPNTGTQFLFSTGVRYKTNRFDLQLAPRFLVSFNSNSSIYSFPTEYSNRIWNWYYDEINRIDRPYNFNQNLSKIFFGNSFFTVNLNKIKLGISTASEWLGAAKFNSLAITNTGPGFPHLFIKSNKQKSFLFFNYEFILFSGLLSNSNFNVPLKKINNLEYLNQSNSYKYDRYLNGISITLNPKFFNQFYLGITRLFYSGTKLSGFKDFFPVFITGRDPVSASTILDKKDQMFILMTKLRFPKSGFELYAEIGRNDFSLNTRDFLMNPDHTFAYVVGFSKKILIKNRSVILNFEISDLSSSLSNSINRRGQEGWYRHNEITQGYTNYGQIIGAGIGTGSKSINTEMLFFNNKNVTSKVQLNYIENNNDFLNNAFNSEADKTAWSGYDFSFSRSISYSKKINFSIKSGLLLEKNSFWLKQAQKESNNLRTNDFVIRLRPYLGVNAEFVF